MTPQSKFELTPKQTRAWYEYLSNPAILRILFDGGARSGKTDVVLAWLVNQAGTYSRARILCARKYLAHAIATTWVSLLKLLHGAAGYQIKEADHEVIFQNRSVIRIGGLDDAERVDKILGDEYLHMFLNEATQLDFATVGFARTRLAQTCHNEQSIPAVRKLILDCNPKSTQHWLYKVGVKKQNPETDAPLPDASAWGRLSWTPFDNPHLPADFIETLNSLPGTLRRRMLDGEWCDDSGGIMKREWFARIIPARPTQGRFVRAWDLAASTRKTSDYTSGALMHERDKTYTLCDIRRERVPAGSVESLIVQTAAGDPKGTEILIEQEPGSSGLITSSYLVRALAGYIVRPVPATGDKVTRALPFISQAAAGNVTMVAGDWIATWLEEATQFPDVDHDDQVDAVATAFNGLAQSGGPSLAFS